MTTTKQAGLTPGDVAELRRPYNVNAIKWLPIGSMTKSGSQQLMPYIDASLVIERLNDVDPAWTEDTLPMVFNPAGTDPFGLAHQSPWRCELTVKGVTRRGVGQLDAMSARVDGKHLKAGESDALKRAALKFGVGAYLRALPPIYLPQMGEGGQAFWTKGQGNDVKFGGLKPAGKKILRAEYEKVVGHELFVQHYGTAVDYGDQVDDVEDAVATTATGGVVDNDEVMPTAKLNTLLALSKYTGRDTPTELVRSTYEGQAFEKVLPRVLNGIKANLQIEADDATKLFTAAVAAAEGDETKLAELVDALDLLEAAKPSGDEPAPEEEPAVEAAGADA